MKNLILSLTVFLLFSFDIFSQVSHTINFSFEKLIVSQTLGADKITYTKVVYDDLQKTDELGSPELPVKYINLIIPSNQKVKDIAITLSNQKIFNITSPIYPVQPEIPTSIHIQEIQFVSPNSKIYESDKPFPDKNSKIVHDGYFDGNNHIITVAIYPLQYIPKLNQLVFTSTIDIMLEMEATAAPNIIVRKRKQSNQKLYDDILNNMVDNPQDVPLYQVKPIEINSFEKIDTQPAFYEYVIITSNAFKNNFNKLIEWKKRKGIDIGIVTTEEIYANYTGDLISGIYDNAGKVRQYLSDAYQDGTIWALLAGDYIVVPIRYGAGDDDCDWSDKSAYKIPTDLYFADFTGDWNVDIESPTRYGEPNNDLPDYNPEIFVGRLLCSSSQDIVN